MFLVNSRLDLFAAAARGSGSVSHHPRRHPFSRSYGVILPSSLTMVLPIALVFSTHPPVSVCGTGPGRLPRGFSREHGLTRFALAASSGASGTWHPRFARCRPTRHHGDVQNPAELPFSVAPSVVAPPRGCRNVDLPCVGYAFRPRLSPRLTLGGLALPRKPWVHGGGVSSRRSRYSCQHPHSRQVHRGSSPGFAPDGKLPYHRTGSGPPLRCRA